MDNDLTGQADLATGGAQAAPAANPYLDLLQNERAQSDAQLHANLSTAVGTKPDAFAKAKRTADYLGYPVAAVEALPHLDQQAQVQQVAQNVQASPALQRAYTDADFAKLAHDDSGTLSKLQSALLYTLGAGGTSAGGNVDDASLAGDIYSGLKGSAAKLAKTFYAAGGALPVAADALTNLVTGRDGNDGRNTPLSDAYFEHTLAVADKAYAATALPSDAGTGRKAVHAVGDLIGTLGAVFASGGSSEAPAAAAATDSVVGILGNALGHATRAMAVPATSDAVNTYQAVLDHTGDARAAAKAAVAQYGVSTASGMLPLSVEGGLATRLATGFLGGAVQGEASRVAMNAVLPEGMQSGFNADDALVSGITGMGLAGVMGPRAAPSFHDAIRQTYVDARAAESAETGAQQLQQISDLATESKLRDRDPATFKQTLASMAENPDALQAVFVKGEDLDQALAAGGLGQADVARLMPDVADQLAQARATGGDVRIPIADYATHIAGSPVEAALVPHLRTDADGMTFKESQEYFEQHATGLKDQATQLVQNMGQDDQNAADLQGIHDTVLGQLNDTGRYRPEVSKAYAALTRDYYAATSERAGMTPAELFAAHPLRVEAAEREGEHLDQGPAQSTAESSFTDKTGAEQRTSLTSETFGYGARHPNSVMVKAFDAAGNRTGFIDFDVRPDGVLTAQNTQVDPSARGKGVAEGMYRAARAAGYDIAPGQVQTDKGLKMVESLQAKGVINKDADGPRFRAGDLELAQDARGTYSPSTGTITALKDADLSTFLHELGHHFFETHTRLAAAEGAPEGIRADLQTFLDHVGEKSTPEEFAAKSLDERREAHEQFARSFEAYLMEGKAPSMELQGLFSRFRAWLVNVYHSLSALRVDLSPEVRGVMDRMLASDSVIADAERTRGMLGMDKPPEGATDKQFQAYLDAGGQATEQAKAEMTARSIRDMRWLSNAKSKALKALQREGKDARKSIQSEVAAQVRELPVYKAKAELDDRQANQAEAAKQHEVQRDKAVEDAKREAGAAKLKGAKAKDFVAKRTAAWDEAHPEPTSHPAGAELDMIAERYGFAGGEDMTRSIAQADPEHVVVEGLTDQRMLQEHGELTDERSIERAAEAAIHNDARARFMATGLKLLTKSPVSPTQLARAAREAAESAVGAKAVKDLAPRQYAAAEKRANRELLKAAPKDTEGAVKAQREALLNNQLFRAATAAIEDVRKGLDYLKRFDRDSMRQKMALDVRDQIDGLLEKFDLRKNPSDEPTRAQQNLEDWLTAQAKAGYAATVTPDMLSTAPKIHYGDMTVEQFRGLVDSVKALEQVGRQRQTITVDGKKIELDAFIHDDLAPKIAERGERFTEDELNDRIQDRTSNPFLIGLDHFTSWLRRGAAQLKPREFQRNEYDRHELLGPFGRAITDPMMNAAYRKVDMLRGLSDDFGAAAEKLGREWQDSLREPVKNTTLVDNDRGDKAPMRFTRGRMLGLALHVGNESNFDKVTKGWGWEPATTLKFLSDNMTAKDWSAVQTVWDLYEKHWPDTEAMYRRLGQTIPDKIAARPFQVTTADGTVVDMKGGYARISYDPLRSRRGEKEQSTASIDPSEGLFGRDYFRGDTPTNGSMNKRVDGYTDRVDLDYHTIARNLTESIHDLAYRETLMDVHKILEHPEFRDTFRRSYGREAYRGLQEWLGQLANGQATDRSVDGLTKFLAYTRTGMVINAIAFRASTVAKHGGSALFKTMGYFAGGGEKYLASRVASMGTDYRNQIASAQAKFPEIRARLMQQDRDFRVTSHALFEPESKLAQAERFGHAAVAWGDMMSAVPTAWGAYDRAITEGIPVSQGGTGKPMTEEQAVNYANKIVREAHGSQNEAGRSAIMSSNSEAVKMFTTLYGFMNTTYGQQLDAVDKIRTKGISAAPVLARTFAAVIVPALWAAVLTHGKPDKDKGESLGGWVAKAIGAEVASSVPLVRDAVSMFEGYSHAGQVAAESWLSTMVQVAHDVTKIGDPDAKTKIVKDIANAAGMGLHIPGLGQLGTSLQYLEDVREGKAHPNGAIDFIKGVFTGHDAKP